MSTAANTQARSRVEFAICREWRNAGRWDFSQAELDAEVDRRLRERRLRADNLPLFDNGETSRATRANACLESLPKLRGKKGQIAELLSRAGKQGLTRDEISDRLAVPVNHVTRPILDLIRVEQIACETGEIRMSRYGKPSAVVALRKFIGEVC